MLEIVQLAVIGVFLAGIGALIVARVRQRWLVRAILLWLFAPAIPMALVLALGTMVSSSPGTSFYNIAFAVMLIGTIVLVPWLVVGGIGVAIGLALRRRRSPEPDESLPPVVQATPTPASLQTVQSPLSPLPQTRLSAGAPKPHFSQSSPDESIRIDIEPIEWARGQVVHTPRVVESASGRILCDLLGSDWEANTAFPRERYIWLGLRRYRSPGYLFVEFDLDADRYRIAVNSLESPDEEGALGDISDRLEHWWRHATAMASAQAIPEHRVPTPGPFAAWRTALAILIGAIVAIAALTYLSVTYNFDAPRLPMKAPHIPRLP